MPRAAITVLLLILLLGSALPMPGVAAAPTAPISWQGTVPAANPAAWQRAGFSSARFGDYLLPVRLISVPVTDGADLDLRIDRLTHQPLLATPPPADGFALQETLPAAPLHILRDSRSAGRRQVVLALTPIFTVDGQLHQLLSIEAQLLSRPQPAAAQALPRTVQPLSGVRIVVSAAGLQQITSAALAAAGIDLTTAEETQLRLQTRHGDVAFELSGSGSNRTLRFYAPPPGDRWNRSDTYWLTRATPPAEGWPRITPRDAITNIGLPGAGRAVAVEAWTAPQQYLSTIAGTDGDHWFSAELTAAGGQILGSTTIPRASVLPAATGALTATVSGHLPDDVALPAVFSVTLSTSTRPITLTSSGDFTSSVVFHFGGSANLDLLPARRQSPLRILIDRVTITQTVNLALSSAGSEFIAPAANTNYQFTQVPPGAELFDITDPVRPLRLTGFTNQFTNSSNHRRYLLTGQFITPTISPVTTTDLLSPRAVDALYIAPGALIADLAPLISLRTAQGYRVAAVPLEAIYDHWSAGQVDPEAIRSFLAFTVTGWSNPPQSVTLVGDGSVDPLRYNPAVPPTLLPPYLADVDPWIGETACDTCFVRFDSSDPRDDALPDMHIGRLPVKSSSELQTVVRKLVAYEQASDAAVWRSRLLLAADDPDDGGDFAATVGALAATLPNRLRSTMLAYLPDDPDAAEMADPISARAAIAQAWRDGAGLIVYHGHAAPQQWASNLAVGSNGELSYQPLLQIFDNLSTDRLPVLLAMTCLTGAFQTPYTGGMTLDEWLVLNPSGGAAAVWGSSGLGVAYGHAALQQGFLSTLYAAEQPPTIGSLVEAGLLELYSEGICCQQALFHQVLIGDPLTPVRLQPIDLLYLPTITR